MAKTAWAMAARFLAFATTLTAVIVMATSNETAYFITFTYKEKYQYWTEFRIFVYANGFASLYSFLILFLPTGSLLWRSVVFVDAVITVLLMSCFSLAVSEVWTMKNGKEHAGWPPVCPRVPHFCSYATGAVFIALVGILLYCLLVAYSFHVMTNFLLLQQPV